MRWACGSNSVITFPWRFLMVLDPSVSQRSPCGNRACLAPSCRYNGAIMSLLTRISAQSDERSARLYGIGLMLLGVFMFSFGDALGKYLVATYAVGQLLWLRACAALFVLSPLIWRRREEFVRMERPWLQ